MNHNLDRFLAITLMSIAGLLSASAAPRTIDLIPHWDTSLPLPNPYMGWCHYYPSRLCFISYLRRAGLTNANKRMIFRSVQRDGFGLFDLPFRAPKGEYAQKFKLRDTNPNRRRDRMCGIQTSVLDKENVMILGIVEQR